MKHCNICPRNCNIDRDNKVGFCKSKNLKINSVKRHFYEEPIVCGEKGCGAIFFSGCNLKCIFCQNSEISHNNKGEEISVTQLAEIFKKLDKSNVENINLVTPTHFTDEIIEALKIYRPKSPILWNTSGYEKPETIQKLKDYVDIFLFDLKYFDSKLSLEYSKAEDYFNFASQSLLMARKIIPEDVYNEKNKLIKGIIVRHLVLPQATNDSIKIIDFINEKLGNQTIVSLMSQYTPYYKAKQHKILKNCVSELEYKRVVRHLINLNFENAFIQEKSSSDECFIPNFNEKFDVTEFLKKSDFWIDK